MPGIHGEIEAGRSWQVVTSYMLAFFDTYVKDEPSPLLNGPSPDYPEVNMDTHNVGN